MKCLVLAPQRYGIREVALRVGHEWERIGHDVEYDLPNGDAAKIGPVTVGIPGIARWWERWFRRLSSNPDEYDLIWTHQPLTLRTPPVVPDFWRRVVVTFHTTEHAKFDLVRRGSYPQTRLLYHWLTRLLERRFYREITIGEDAEPRFTVVSPQLRDEVATFGVHEANYIPNGLSVPEERSFEPIRQEFNIPKDATVVFNLGSLTPQKRPVLLAETMAEISDQREDLYCVIAGKGPKADKVQQYVSEKLKVIGFISDAEKWRWFSDSDLFVSFSTYEGMPVSALEALSFGLPVVLSDIPAHRALIEEHGATGECARPTREAVSAAIQRLEGETADDSLPTWGEVAREYLELVV